jgi:hypothetical protein
MKTPWPREIFNSPAGMYPDNLESVLRPDAPEPSVTGDFYSAKSFPLSYAGTWDSAEFDTKAKGLLLSIIRHFIESKTRDGRTYIIRLDNRLTRRADYLPPQDDNWRTYQVHGTVLLLLPDEAVPGDLVHEVGYHTYLPTYRHGRWDREVLRDGTRCYKLMPLYGARAGG